MHGDALAVAYYFPGNGGQTHGDEMAVAWQATEAETGKVPAYKKIS